MKKCNCISSDIGYHREDCAVFDVFGKPKAISNKITWPTISDLQKRSRIDRKASEIMSIQFDIIDYHQVLKTYPLDQDKIDSIRKIKKTLDQLIKDFNIKVDF